MNWIDHLPALVLAVPLACAFLAPLASLGGRRVREALFVMGSLLTLALTVLVWTQVRAQGTLVYVMGADSWNLALPSGLAFPVRILLEIDAFSALLGVFGAVASFAGACFSLRFLDRFSGLDKYTSLFFLLTVGLLGMEYTGDLFNFFVFLEIASVASFGLVAFYRDRPEAIEAAFKYMLVSTVGALFVLLAIGFLYGRYNLVTVAAVAQVLQLGVPEKIALVFLVGTLAMKCGAVPMHCWVPDAYAEAPAAVTCLLVATSQASLYGLARVCFSLYGQLLCPTIIPWTVVILGCLSMFVGVTMAVVQKDVFRLMAYHSVSQVGYLLLGLGVGLLCLDDPEAMAEYGFGALQGGVYHLLNYTIYKGLLFLTAGALAYSAGSRNLNELGGLARNLPWTTGFFLVAATAIAGLPPLNGFVSKLLIYESTFAVHPFLAVVAMVTSILTLASFLKVFQTAFLGPALACFEKVREVPLSMRVGMGVLVLCVLVLSLFPSWTMDSLVGPASQALVERSSYIQSVLAAGGGQP